MKMIEAIIQPARLEAVKDALCEVGVVRLTVSDVEGLGGKEKRTETFRGQEYTVDTVRRVKLEIAVNEEFVAPTIDAIMKGAKTGNIGDGKIFVLELAECIRIRTGERECQAIG